MILFLDALIPLADAFDALRVPYSIGGSVSMLDLAYMRRWAADLGLADLLEQALNDARLVF